MRAWRLFAGESVIKLATVVLSGIFLFPFAAGAEPISVRPSDDRREVVVSHRSLRQSRNKILLQASHFMWPTLGAGLFRRTQTEMELISASSTLDSGGLCSALRATKATGLSKRSADSSTRNNKIRDRRSLDPRHDQYRPLTT